MTTEQQQELRELLVNLNSFEANVEVQVLINEIQEALACDITLREFRKRKKQQKKKQITH